MGRVISDGAKIKKIISNTSKLKEFCEQHGGELYVDYGRNAAYCKIGDTKIEAQDFYVVVERDGDVLYEGFGLIKSIEPDRILISTGESDEEIEL